MRDTARHQPDPNQKGRCGAEPRRGGWERDSFLALTREEASSREQVNQTHNMTI
jgi:hypothetical protein